MDPRNSYDSHVIQHNGRTYAAFIGPDYDYRVPWEDGDSCGVVSQDRGSSSETSQWKMEALSAVYWYEVEDSLVRAIQQKWGVPQEVKDAFLAEHGRPMTDDEIITQAVVRDYEHLCAYLAEDWTYATLLVVEVDPDEDPKDEDAWLSEPQYLGGIEYDYTPACDAAIYLEYGMSLIHDIEHNQPKQEKAA